MLLFPILFLLLAFESTVEALFSVIILLALVLLILERPLTLLILEEVIKQSSLIDLSAGCDCDCNDETGFVEFLEEGTFLSCDRLLVAGEGAEDEFGDE